MALNDQHVLDPFGAVFGKPPPTLLDYLTSSSTIATVDDNLSKRSSISTLCENLLRAQNRMRNQVNVKRSDVDFQPRDWVLSKLQPY